MTCRTDGYLSRDRAVVKTEPLGKKVIEGIEVAGTRTTITIPAGQIGNERPIEVVTEQWFSTVLKTIVLSRSSDPRMGESTFRLTNISLAEPAPSLFEAPAIFRSKRAQPCSRR